MSWLIVGGSIEEREKEIENIVGKNGGKFSKNNHDIVNIVFEGKSIGVDAVRLFVKQLFIRPVGKLKVGIIEEGEKLTIEAQNALLKVLEEPPENCIVILGARTESLLLSTVVSRCFIIDLGSKKNLIEDPEREKFLEIIGWVEKGEFVFGSGWTKKIVGRDQAELAMDKLIQIAREEMIVGLVSPLTIRTLLKTKKYLGANTNVRLTMENLFLN